MSTSLDHTHDPHARSWVAAANDDSCEFPLQNLPLCVFRPAPDAAMRPGIGIGDQVLDLGQAAALGLFEALPERVAHVLTCPRLNELFALGREAMATLRHSAWTLLEAGYARQSEVPLQPLAKVQFGLPCDVGDYTDFFSSLNHAMNTFRLFRPGQVFLPNFKHLPIAYHGRASSIVVSGTPVPRPIGQTRPTPEVSPELGPSRKVDFEVELGFYVGAGNALGRRIALDDAEAHLVGVSILNDWSARDFQAWESQPLGPFSSKNFSSSVSPWVVTLDALAPFRAPLAPRSSDDPAPLGYLHSTANESSGAFDIRIETLLQTETMRMRGEPPVCISRAAFARDAWWTPAQMVTHHTVNGCNLRPGDLLGSGTISGPEEGTQGSILELTFGGSRPIQLPGGESRAFVEDGDEVTLVAWCERPGYRRIGLGSCAGRIQPTSEN
ncbi:fumarylacetoacetase [Variovorax sp. CYS-02]|uniref:fumarylacetoacetase n=2 Tax=Variovorax terrae TaxID=2923278 RepID=A0A9X2AMU2_9BURK|nr:fumarylacetoacetase [Variovorax terrae]MCJ0761617.1 fumarylacetoacetase [Variovorax terrae]